MPRKLFRVHRTIHRLQVAARFQVKVPPAPEISGDEINMGSLLATRCLTTSSRKLLVTSASLLVARALMIEMGCFA